jgi:hypothetical protein
MWNMREGDKNVKHIQEMEACERNVGEIGGYLSE